MFRADSPRNRAGAIFRLLTLNLHVSESFALSTRRRRDLVDQQLTVGLSTLRCRSSCRDDVSGRVDTLPWLPALRLRP